MIKMSVKIFFSGTIVKESTMKVKLSWIPFILFTPVLVGLALYTSLFPDADQLFMGFGVSILPYGIAGVTLVMFLFCLLFKAVDRKTADYYVIKRNIPAGLFGLITAASIAAEGGISLLEAKSTGDISAYTVVYVIFTLLAALAIVIMSLMHLTKTTSSKGLSVYLLMPAIWSAIKLVNVFVNNAEISLANTDVLQLLTLIAVTLYMFFYAQLISAVRSRGTLKNTMVMGLVSVSLLIASCSVPVYNIAVSGVVPEIFSVVPLIQNMAFVFYIFSFIAELSSQALRKDELTVVSEDGDELDYSLEDKKARKAEKRARKNKTNSEEDISSAAPAMTAEGASMYEGEGTDAETVRERVNSSDYEDIYSEDNIISFSSEPQTSETDEQPAAEEKAYGENYTDYNDRDIYSSQETDDEKLKLSEAVISEIEKEEYADGSIGDENTNETPEEKMRRIDQLILMLENDDNSH